MKKITAGLFRAGLILFVLSFTGCKKWIDKYFPGHGNGNEKGCQITGIVQKYEADDDGRTGQFYYSNGRLDSVVFDISTGSAGAQFHYWRYNASGKLIEYRADYSREPGDYYFIHKYVYQGNTIVQDSTWVREAGSYAYVSTIDYDAAGRVIKDNRVLFELDGVPVNQPAEPFVYDYDADGNLQLSQPTTYDNKPGFLTTSNVLMFTQRNYSMNNPSGATGYNNKGYPVGFAFGTPGFFLQWGIPTTISYKCKK